MLPPNEKAKAETYMDSNASDDLDDGLVHHLPRRLLNSSCELSLLDKGNKQKSVERTQLPNKKSRKSGARNCKKSTDLLPILKISEASAVPEEWNEINKSLNDVFKAMFFKLAYMQCNMVNVIGTFWRMKLELLLQFYCCQGIAKFHIEIFIE